MSISAKRPQETDGGYHARVKEHLDALTRQRDELLKALQGIKSYAEVCKSTDGQRILYLANQLLEKPEYKTAKESKP